jgi:concentrative nucleoside transporter, CNT family
MLTASLGEPFMQAWQGLVGVAAIPLLAWGICEDRSALPLKRAAMTVAGALALQGLIAVLLLRWPAARVFFDVVGQVFLALRTSTEAGMRVVFGYLAGGATPFEIKASGNAFLLGFQALPLIMVLSALARLLYHWGALQAVVRVFARVLQGTFGIGGPLGTAAAAKVFVGMVEAPLLIRPYLQEMGRGALFAIMVVGMATVAGTVMALYGAILEPLVPGAAGHVLAASIMNVPGALMLARLAVPTGFEDGPVTAEVKLDNPPRSSMDAVVQGTGDGVRLLGNVIGLLVVMVALVSLFNGFLGFAAGLFGFPGLTLQTILGHVAAPLAWAIGIPAGEAVAAGGLLAEKIVLNEFVAYLDMAQMPPETLSPASRLIMTYALCGFANVASLGIMIGGLTAMAPGRRDIIIELAPKSMLFGALATCLSGALVGVISGV